MQKLASRPAQAEPAFGESLASDADAAGAYLAEMEAALHGLGPSAEREGEGRAEAQAIKEMTAVGLKHVKTHEDLPQQHLMVFEKPR